MGKRLLEVGQIIKTNYNTGPYRIKSIHRECTCPECIRSINGDDSPSLKHIHLIVKDLNGGRGDYYLNGYNEETLKSVWSDDYLILCEDDQPIQISLFH